MGSMTFLPNHWSAALEWPPLGHLPINHWLVPLVAETGTVGRPGLLPTTVHPQGGSEHVDSLNKFHRRSLGLITNQTTNRWPAPKCLRMYVVGGTEYGKERWKAVNITEPLQCGRY